MVAVLGAGDGVPGFNTHKARCAGLTPDKGVGKCGNIADHTSAGALFINTQGLGGKTYHAVAVVGEKAFVDGDGVGVLSQVVSVALEKTGGHAV